MWQEQMSVEQQVALNMGDVDSEDWEDVYVPPGEQSIGCTRAKTMEVEKSNYLEAEPIGLKFNPMFDQ